MTATVRFYAGARAAAGVGQAEVRPGPLTEVLAELVERFGPELARVLPVCTLLCDGTHVGSDSLLGPGAVLEVLPPFAGG